MALGAFIDLSIFVPTPGKAKLKRLASLINGLRSLNFPITIACSAVDKDKFKSFEPLVYKSSFLEVIGIDKIVAGHRLLFCPYKTEARDVLGQHFDFQTLELYFDEGFITVATSKHGRFNIKEGSEEELAPLLVHLMQEFSFSSAFKIVDQDREPQTIVSRGKVLTERIPTVELKRNSPASQPKIEDGKGKLRIKPLTNWTSTSHLVQEWTRLLNPSLPFALVESEPDIYLVINATNEATPPERTIYFMMEPFGENLFKDYLKHLNQNMKPLFYGCHKHHLNCVEWHIKPDWTSLLNTNVPKDVSMNRKLSVIVSDRSADPGQVWRLGFVKELDRRSREGTLPFSVDIWGKCASLGFANYKGEIPRISKEIGLVGYKYHFNAENNRIANYVTEKFFDSVLCNCYTFYRGCPNLSDYFDSQSFCEMPEDYSVCVDIISKAMDRDQWTISKGAIERTRKDVLLKWGLSSRILGIWSMSRSLVLFREPGSEAWLESQGFHYFAHTQFDPASPHWMGVMAVNVISKMPEEQRAFPIVIVMTQSVVQGDPLFYQKCAQAIITNECDIISFGLSQADFMTSTMILKSSAHPKLIENANKVKHVSQAHLLLEAISIKYAKL